MTHYRLQDDVMPSAIVLAKNPRSGSLDELKSYQGNFIYLNNGDEFQIRLFNPLREKIGVQIGFNGDLSESMLVLNPGEDVTVDRFLDNKQKMLFETYSYDSNNAAASNAVAENGIVSVNFFKELKTQQPYYSTTGDVTLTTTGGYVGHQSSGNYTLSGSTTTNVFHTNSLGFESPGINYKESDLSQSSGNITLDGGFTDFDTSNNNSRCYSSTAFDNQFSTMQNVAGMGTVPSPEPLKKETGRIEKGENSDQDFKEVSIEFEIFPFHNVNYYLKPTSERTKTTTITESKVRNYCSSCSYRVRNDKWVFCPKCGEKID